MRIFIILACSQSDQKQQLKGPVYENFLKEAFHAAGLPEEMRMKWLRIDEAFKAAILKASPAECTGRYKNEPIINVPNPKKRAA